MTTAQDLDFRTGRPPGNCSPPSANVTTQASSTAEGLSPPSALSTEICGGQSWTLSRRARQMVEGEVFHALRRSGADADYARAASKRAGDWCRVLPAVPFKPVREPRFRARLRALQADRKALAQAVAFAWLIADRQVDTKDVAA